MLRLGLKLKKSMGGKKKSGEGKVAGFKVSSEMLQMLGGFTLLRLTSLVGMMNVSFTKEELLKINKKLNRIKKPNK